MKTPTKFQIFLVFVMLASFVGLMMHLYTGAGSFMSISYTVEDDPSSYYSSVALLVLFFLGSLLALLFGKAK